MTPNRGVAMTIRHCVRRSLWAAALVAACAGRPPGAQAAPGQSLNLAASLATWYDSNLLQYSDVQLSQFDSGLYPNRFSIESKDDITLNPSLALTWELDQGGGRRHSVRLKADGDFHHKNGTADFRAASLAWRERFGGSGLLLRGYMLPAYYVRQLHVTGTGVTPGVYDRAQFDLSIGEAAWSQALRPGLTGGASYQLERRVYAPHFPERTSTTHQGELSLEIGRLPRHASIELLGAWRSSRADGRTLAPGQLRSTSDVGYHGWWTAVNGRTELSRRRGLRTGGDLDYRL